MKKTSKPSLLTKEEQYVLSRIKVTKEQIRLAQNLSKDEVKKAINLKNDIIFRLIFGSKGNERITKDFLEGVLGYEIDSVELDQNTIILPEIFDEKIGILDVKVKLKDGTIIDIEMQNSNEYNFVKRAHFYVCRVYSKQVEEGVSYANLKKAIGIFILNYDLLKEKEEFATTYKMTNIKDINANFDELEMHYIELPKFEKAKPDLKNKLNQWIYYLINKDEEAVKMAVQSNTAIKEVDEKIRKMEDEEALKYLAFLRMKGELDYNSNIEGARAEGEAKGRAEGEAKGRAEGEAKGRKESKKIIAKKLLKTGMSITEIAEITEMSEEEISKL